nr:MULTISPECIES: hypothetical protein [unclassified Nocardioides]
MDPTRREALSRGRRAGICGGGRSRVVPRVVVVGVIGVSPGEAAERRARIRDRARPLGKGLDTDRTGPTVSGPMVGSDLSSSGQVVLEATRVLPEPDLDSIGMKSQEVIMVTWIG